MYPPAPTTDPYASRPFPAPRPFTVTPVSTVEPPPEPISVAMLLTQLSIAAWTDGVPA
jgi:hypothetical protein